MSVCSTCGAPMLWTRTEKGNRMPLDPDPYEGDDPRGLFVLREEGGTPLALAVPPDAFPGEPVYRSHFATCPDRDQHRRPQPRPDYDPRVDHPERYREGPV